MRYGYAARLRPPRCSRANSRSHSPSARAESRRGARDRWARHAAFSLMCSTAALRGIYGLESRSLCVPRVACCCRCGSRLDPCRRVCLRGLSGSPLLSRCPSLSPLSLSLARESPSRRPSWYCDDRLQEGGAPAPGGATVSRPAAEPHARQLPRDAPRASPIDGCRPRAPHMAVSDSPPLPRDAAIGQLEAQEPASVTPSSSSSSSSGIKPLLTSRLFPHQHIHK